MMRRILGTALALGLAASAAAAPSSWADPAGGGTVRWTTTYDAGTPAWTDAVTLTPDGSTVIETGRSKFPGGHMATVAFDAGSGALRWSTEFPADDDQFSSGDALTTSPDGSTVYVAGTLDCWHACTSSPFSGFVVVAYSVASGDKLWVARFAGDGGAPQTVEVSPDGAHVYLSAVDGWGAATLLSYDAANGAKEWAVPGPTAEGYYEGGLAISPDGSTLVTAETDGTYYNDGDVCGADGIMTTAYDAADGAQKWSSTYSVAGARSICGTSTDIGLSPDGSRAYVTGYGGVGNHEGTYRANTIAYDVATGAQIWAVEDADISTHAGDIKISLAVDPGGDAVYIAGDDCSSYPSCSASTIAYDAATGSRLWNSHFDGGGEVYTADLVVSPDGSGLFLTGQLTLPCLAGCDLSEVDAPLVAYDADTGAERWATMFPDNGGSALAVSPDSSSLYLAGTFAGSTSSTRMRTACSGQCGYSAVRFNTRAGPGTFQDPENSFRYGEWRGVYATDAIAGALRESKRAGATASMRTPAATSLSWLTRQGPDQGKAILFLDGKKRGVYDLYAPEPTARAVTINDLDRRPHTVRVKVLGKKAARSTGTWVAVDGFRYRGGNGVSQESSPRVKYDSWSGAVDRRASGGTFRKSSARGSTISLDFKGRTLRWLTATGPSFGRAIVVIDGRSHRVDLYRTTKHWRVPFTFDHLGRGGHQVTIKATGRKDAASGSAAVVVDALVAKR